MYDRIVGLVLDQIAVDGSITKAPGGGAAAGRSPVDRGKQGLQRSGMTDSRLRPRQVPPPAVAARHPPSHRRARRSTRLWPGHLPLGGRARSPGCTASAACGSAGNDATTSTKPFSASPPASSPADTSNALVRAPTDDLGVMSPDGRRDLQVRHALAGRHHAWNLSNAFFDFAD